MLTWHMLWRNEHAIDGMKEQNKRMVVQRAVVAVPSIKDGGLGTLERLTKMANPSCLVACHSFSVRIESRRK